MKMIYGMASILALVLTAGAQNPLMRRANIVGGGPPGHGKCTVAVSVDGAAEVEIVGDRGFLHNLSGQEPYWQRMECTEPMPSNVSNFRLVAIEGRGRQTLIADPRNNGRAVVRIDDPQGGREGYAFELAWNGGPGFGAVQEYRDERYREYPQPEFTNELNFNGRGDGFLRNRWREERINDLNLTVHNDFVRANFRTDNGTSIFLTGRVTSREGNQIVARMEGAGMAGTMFIHSDGNGIRSVSMATEAGFGRAAHELRWRMY